MSREKMPKITVQIEIEPDVLAYAIQGVAEQLELEILEMGLNPTQRDASRVAGLATAAKLLSKELSAWRDHILEGHGTQKLKTVA